MKSEIFTYLNASSPTLMDGPMSGISVAIEPNISVKNWPTNAQSIALENYVALEDSTLVERLRNAGATLKGRTSMSELGLGLNNDTGGDAIKNELSDVVLKTDTTGETRMAAAVCECFGFKPSYGIVSRLGMIGLVPSMESCGILSDSLQTISETACIMAGSDKPDSSIDESGIDRAISGFKKPEKLQDRHISAGIIREWDTGKSKEFEQAMTILRKAGIQIEKISIKDFSLARTVHNVIGTVEASSSAGRFDSVRYGHRTSGSVKNWNDMYIKSRSESFGPLVKAYLFQGGYFQYKKYNTFLDACRIRACLIESINKAFETVDIIVLPVSVRAEASAEKPDTVTDLYDSFSLTLLANLTGNPSISIPGPVNVNGGRPAVQLIGQRFDDAHLLTIAEHISKIFTGAM